VRNTVIGLNFVDIYYRRGTLPVPEFPAIIGDEAVAAASGAASVRVWEVMSRGRARWTG
jgi:NADPH2:quinone reductase